MEQLTDKQAAQFFHRSYTAVDGLWFMKVEERFGFDVALEIDAEVWRVFPKIQARALKAALDAASGLQGLSRCLAARLAAEGFRFRVDADSEPGGLTVDIEHCPWHALMEKSGRVHLSGKVGTTICNIEYRVWAAEFGPGISFSLEEQICTGHHRCRLRFWQESQAEVAKKQPG